MKNQDEPKQSQPTSESGENSETDLGGLITFVPDLDLEWELGFEIEILFEPE